MRTVVFIFVVFTSLVNLNAQVEVFRNAEDTSIKIRPEDTITLAPKFESGDVDFLRYIETHFSIMSAGSSLSYSGHTFKFSFYVEKDGSISDFNMISFGDAIIASELERVVLAMPKWSPGVYIGKKKRTMMVYDIQVKKVNDFNALQVTLNESDLQYTRSTNPLKWFLVAGTLMIMTALYIIRS